MNHTRVPTVDFLVKYVRADKVDGRYLPELSGKEAVWNTFASSALRPVAELIKGRGETVPVEGEVVIFRENVDFIQVLGG